MRTTLTRTRLKKDYPLCFVEFLKIGGDGFVDLHTAIDSLLFKFGIGIKTVPIYASESERILGHESYIIIYQDNAFKEEAREYQVIEDFRKYKDLRRAKIVTYLAGLDDLEGFLHHRIRTID